MVAAARRLPVPLFATLFLALATIAVAACTPKPEERVREAIGVAVEAAEQARFDVLREVVSKRYSDSDGHTRETLVEEARGYIELNQPLHIFTSELSLTRSGPDRIEVELIVAMASTPIGAVRDIARVGADVGVVSLAFAEEEDGAWRVVRAAWRPATTRDFLPHGQR